MSVKTAFMKAFGFHPSDDDDDDDDSVEYASAAPLPRQKPQQQSDEDYPSALPPVRRQNNSATTADNGQIQPTDDESADMPSPEFPLTIFDGLLQVFNEAQPDFIRKCLDMDAQRRYLYDSMDASFKDYLGRLQNEAMQFAEKKCSRMLRTHTDELQQLRDKLAGAEKHLEEQKQQNLSATRQKRALTDRVRDLEQQIETAQAEKEQYALETKSLLNKLKVAQVRESSAASASDSDVAQYRAAAEEANRQVSLLNAQAVARQNEIDNMTAQLKNLTAEAEKARKLAEKTNDEIDQLRRRCAEAESLRQSAEEEARQATARAEQAQSEISRLESRLAENFSAGQRQTVFDDGPFGQPSPATDPEPRNDETEQPVRRQRRRKKPKNTISAIDDTLDTTEWLLPTPPGGQQKSPIVSDAEFGYHEPLREDPPRNDAQLSLFD